MVRLTILGDLDLRSADGTVVGSVLNQPRRLALLVYLVLEGGSTGVQRDRLLGVFWPEQPQKKARQSLRTALHFLRRSLGPDSLVTRGDLVAVDPGGLGCDASAFRAALDDEDAEEALRLYAGDLLPAFYLDGAPPEFEHWLERARASFRRDAATAAWQLAEAREQAGNAAGAGAWARRAVELSEGDEAAVRRSIELLGRVGDRAGALAAYEGLERQLSEQFEVEPSPETQAAIERVRDQSEPSFSDTDTAPAADPLEPERAPSYPGGGAWWQRVARVRHRRPVRTVVSAAATVVLTLSFYSLWGVNSLEPAWTMPGAGLRPVIQVEEIRDFSGEGPADGATGDLAAALTMELTARLGETEGLRVVTATADSPGPGGDAGPSYVVRGWLLRTDSLARVTAMLVDGESGATLERIVAERPITDATTTLDELIEVLGVEVRRQVGRAVGDYQRRLVAKDDGALELVRSGLHDLEVGDSLRTAGAAEAAAVAYEAADSQLALAQAAAPRWPEPSVQRAELALQRLWLHLVPSRDPAALAATIRHGLRHAEAALEIAPDYPAALEMMGALQYWAWAVGPEAGRSSAGVEAEEYLRRATAADPSLANAWNLLSLLQEARGEFGVANVSARRAYRADAYLQNSNSVLIRLATTSLEIGDPKSATRWCGEIERHNRGGTLPLYCRLTVLAWEPLATPDSLRNLIDRATHQDVPDLQRAHLGMLGAVALARAGLHEEAVSAVQRWRRPNSVDLTLAEYEGWARLILGEEAVAAALLKRGTAAHPQRAARILDSSRFRHLFAGTAQVDGR